MTVVERELTLLRPRFKECYRQTIDGGVRVSGRAVLGVMIRKDGSVEDVSVVEDSGLGTGLLGCITQAIKTYRFVPPEDGGTASFRVPLEFHPADGG
jgi:TonB family protein